MVDVRDFQDFLKSVENKSDAKFPPVLASASGSVSQAKIATVNIIPSSKTLQHHGSRTYQ